MPADLENRQSQNEHSFRSDERVRIARELHDSTLQPLATLELELGRLKRLGPTRAAMLVKKCEEELEEIRRQIAALAASARDR